MHVFVHRVHNDNIIIHGVCVCVWVHVCMCMCMRVYACMCVQIDVYVATINSYCSNYNSVFSFNKFGCCHVDPYLHEGSFGHS